MCAAVADEQEPFAIRSPRPKVGEVLLMFDRKIKRTFAVSQNCGIRPQAKALMIDRLGEALQAVPRLGRVDFDTPAGA